MFPEMPWEVQEEQKSLPLVALLKQTALFLWKDWPKDMEALLIDIEKRRFNLRGICPHCRRDAAFLLVTSVFGERVNSNELLWVAGMACQGCLEYILAIVLFNEFHHALSYMSHYPLGKPDDRVAKEIPEHIQPDFREALRCLFVDAYNATAEMCRRAIEASCLNLGAPKKDVLEDMIDWLADQRIITPLLQQAAHKVRLGGNRGAHPSVDGAVVPATPKPKD
jgi:hypothetical protein